VDQLVLAIECDPATDIVCTPASVNELFETPVVFSIGGFDVNRAMLLMLFAAFLAIALMYFAYRRPRLVPSRYGTAVEGMVGFVRDEVAVGIIGPEGVKYFPYLVSLFFFILIGNFFEITPLINFPITSRMAIPMFLALLTWVIFVFVGFKKHGFGYLKETLFPPGVPKPLYLLVTPIELVSTFIVRPFSLAVRLFANLVAGHVMLSLLLVSGFVFLTDVFGSGLSLGDRVFRLGWGSLWSLLGLAIFLFEILVSLLQAYIFTLLSAVYIQSSVHVEH
jgi:F-type H+-transporting ATPase subunit a